MTTDNDSTTGATLDDLRNELATFRATVRSNNETVRLYPDAGDTAFGVIRHDYEGFPAQGTVLYDVVGFDIVDMDFEPHDDMTMAEEFEQIEDDVRTYIREALFDGRSRASAHTSRTETHTICVEHPHEGNEWVIELDTANKRRVA